MNGTIRVVRGDGGAQVAELTPSHSADVARNAAVAGPAAQNALWHGYSLGMVVAGCLTILSIAASLVMIRPKRNQEQPAGDEAHHRAPTEAADA